MATKQFPYAVKVVADYLRINLGGIRVATEVPATWSGSLVTVTSVPGSGPRNLVLSMRRMVIQCWNSNELVAGTLAEQVRQLLVDVPYTGVRWLRDVNVVGEPGRFDDPDTGVPRFQLTVDVLVRALTD